MHSVPRGSRSRVPDPSELVAATEQAAVLKRALAFRRARDTSLEALAVVARALIANPDEYTLWALRREALLELLSEETADLGIQVSDGAVEPETTNVPHTQQEPSGVEGPEGRDSSVQERRNTHLRTRWRAELDVSLTALKRHPKAYPAWQHRLWLLSCPRLVSQLPVNDLKRAVRAEYEMSELILARDGRNFHGWAHRMRVHAIAPPDTLTTPSEELEFITGKINDDFANYSAWHHRSALLPTLHRSAEAFIDEELEFVRQAFYTEPDVQSAWFYHRWLLAGAPARGVKTSVRADILVKELTACDELLTIEPDARWALHAKVDLLEKLGREDEAVPVLGRLAELDPMRRGFYAYKRSRLTANPTITCTEHHSSERDY